MDAVRKAIESLYDDVCTITEYKSVTDPITHQTSQKPVMLLIEQPCRISFENAPVASTDSAPVVKQIIKLFISPDVDLLAGSKITVTHRGKNEDYCRSGKPIIHSNHQEILLDLYRGHA